MKKLIIILLLNIPILVRGESDGEVTEEKYQESAKEMQTAIAHLISFYNQKQKHDELDQFDKAQEKWLEETSKIIYSVPKKEYLAILNNLVVKRTEQLRQLYREKDPEGYASDVKAEEALKEMNDPKHKSSEELKKFAQGFKTIEVGLDTPDDVLKKIGSPWERHKINGTEQIQWYPFLIEGSSITSVVQIAVNGRVSYVSIKKDGNDIYTKGTWEMPGMATSSDQATSPKESTGASDHFPLKETAPDNPTEGQIYFNKTEKHFYGWDGTAWLKLDTKQ